MSESTISVLLCALIATPGLADQNVYDQRREQSLRPQFFDVKHYRIALTLNEEAKSFVGETAITFSSTVDGLKELKLDAETFKVSSVKTVDGKALSFIQGEGKGNLVVALGHVVEPVFVDLSHFKSPFC